VFFSTRASSGGGTENICDGVDNDGNGIVDDVDLGGDGVCDCLAIATIGTSESWLPAYPTNVFQGWLAARSTTPAVALGNQIITPELNRPLSNGPGATGIS
jgi:hypothetical protein